MSNDLFDRKIKKRLESINSPVSLNVWTKVEKQLAIPWYNNFWRRYALPMYSVLTTVLLFLSLTGFLMNKEQINLLNEKIATINKVNTQPTTKKTIVLRDTVFIEKILYVRQGSNNTIQPNLYLNQLNEKKINKLIVSGLDKNKSENVFKQVGRLSGLENPISQILGQDTSNQTQIDKNTILTNMVNTVTKVEPKKDTTTELALSNPKPDITPTSPAKKVFKFPKINARFGLSSSIGTEGDINLGPVVELFLNPNLSFSTGLGINKYRKLEYGSSKQFNLNTGQDFLDLYSSKIPKNYDLLSEININTSILELPLILNYYVPIKRNFDLKFSFGTHIDMELYQNIQFETYQNGEEIYTEFNTLAAKNSWHNMILGVGGQYRHKNIVFQVSPSYLYNYREVDYIKSGGAFRIIGSVLLNISNQ
jgi:hypothetical protein